MPNYELTNKHFIICLLLFICTGGFAQKDYRTESLTVTDGLSQGFIVSLFEDRRGFIWIGTFNGLNRYDGYKVKRFPPDQTTSWALNANYIFSITEDAQGLIWLGTDRGVVVMDPYTERFVSLYDLNPQFPEKDVLHVVVGQGGRIWLSCRLPSGPKIVAITPPAGLVQLIRQDKIKPGLFAMQEVPLAEGLKGPLRWLHSDNDTSIQAIDPNGRFCQFHPSNGSMQSINLAQTNYQRMGPYGLLYYAGNSCGIVFQAPATPEPTAGVVILSDFLKIPDEMPILYRTGDPVLHQLDTMLRTPEILNPAFRTFYKQFPLFLELDRAISYRGLTDRSGNLWVGTNSYGVRKITRKKLKFRQYLDNQSFYNFRLMPDGRIWPGVHQPYKIFNPANQQLEDGFWNTPDLTVKPHCILVDRIGDWWLSGMRNDSFFILKRARGARRWQELPTRFNHFDGIDTQLKEDSKGSIWVLGLREEVARIRPKEMLVDRWPITSLLSRQVPRPVYSNCMAEDPFGAIWIGWNHALLRIEEPQGQPRFQVWDNYSGGKIIFKNDWLLSMYPDANQQNVVWIGTRNGGLHRFDAQTGTVQLFTEINGLADNVVYGILPDAFGYLWLSTNRGLSRFNPSNETFFNFTNEHPKLNTEFNTNASLRLPSGELAFGSVNGLLLIQPLQEKTLDRPSVVEITELKVNGKVLDFSTQESYFSLNRDNEISLRLPSDQNSIALEFAALLTGNPASAQYRYRMVGLNKNWIHAGIQRIANFVLIPPGKYTLELQSINLQGHWESAPITRLYVTIVPPWYQSPLAYVLYALLFALLVYTYLRYERRHLRLKYAEEINGKEIERLKSLDDFKNRFFGYISHEFKTPLTIILGHAKRMVGENNQQNAEQQARAILQQGQSMIEMVSQMVDITKLDRNEIRLNWRNGPISNYVQNIVESLRSLADFKNIQLDFRSTAPGLMMDFDPLRLKFIIHNLMNNAITHTHAGGALVVSVHQNEPDEVTLEVSDTGKGIAPEVLPRIFDRYFQAFPDVAHPAEPHFGLGLTFVKDLVELFEGSISVESKLGKGTVFSVTLPVKNNAIPLQDNPSDWVRTPLRPVSYAETQLSKKDLPLLLVVEDNPFISNFIHQSLEPHFRLEFAQDGLAGYEKALESIPDLILTDVMMPGLNGYELTHRLKTHTLTGHIPVVILSARSALSDRLNGQEFGANAYIGKPFDEKELVLTLKNLFRLQQHWRERYQTIPKTGRINDVEPVEQPAEIVQQTDTFMLKIYTIFERNYVDDTYDLNMLCRDLELSKSQLQRKLSILSDMSAMELLRQYRLQKAHDMLSTNPGLTVKEICFMVGFKDPAHFSRLFSKTFHTPPSDVKKGEK